MSTNFSKDNLEMHEAFTIIYTLKSFNKPINDLIELILFDQLNYDRIQKVLHENELNDITEIKEDILDLLIMYINIVLNDHVVSEIELRNMEILKLHFKIKEGDFYNFKLNEIKEVLQRQFKRIYLDNIITLEEAIHSADLQGLFDLSYDQFDALKADEVKRALEEGADIKSLDTAKIPSSYLKSFLHTAKDLSESTKKEILELYNNECVKCDAKEYLNYVYILPLAMGGNNTVNNIKLLCNSCLDKEV